MLTLKDKTAIKCRWEDFCFNCVCGIIMQIVCVNMEYSYALNIWRNWSVNTTNDAALSGKNIGRNNEVGKKSSGDYTAIEMYLRERLKFKEASWWKCLHVCQLWKKKEPCLIKSCFLSFIKQVSWAEKRKLPMPGIVN